MLETNYEACRQKFCLFNRIWLLECLQTDGS